MNSVALPSSFQDAAVTEAVKLIEETGPLDDAQAVRHAMALQGDAAARIAERAQLLGQRIGLQAEMARARAWAPWVLLALVALIVVAGLTLAGSVLGGGQRQINVVVALTSLLGLHLVTLLLWLAGLVLPLGAFQASFGWLWLSLTARVAAGRSGQAPVLLRATTRLLARARLLPWALGLASHAIWTLSFAVVLAALLFALAFRNYTLSWETTILEPDFFVRSVQWLGRAPAWLGFPVPDAQAVLSPLAAASGQRAWALWLTGCIVVYGLLPRLALALLSAAVCALRRQALQPDLSEPYFQRLLARFDALAPRQIVDADPGRIAHGRPAHLSAGDTADTLVAIGFELPPEQDWPPVSLDTAARILRIDGSAAQRRELLDMLAHIRPRRAVIGCRAAASPDRGTERFLREVMALCGECRLWLVGAPDDAAARGRWQAWLADAGLDALGVAEAPEAVMHGWA
ncbi:DUF2868 domain-containing protein [Variovorax ginsengisoli]|uniref:DUF2868 domain-containing protein n=1 Tax=Variovorax ginsengisoli TaxID=363844 RepID=A0ABT8S8H6_9BURK|nr:DUF2868 domain-containing protein [Variovorax ginsengisoli]MDN8614551.1 DUF2868 domain-containing protein [Variovorax ginsengisoli]MDO1533721.1 DUF2868 domain-containing protein [Variovorax ginsengisoli]